MSAGQDGAPEQGGQGGSWEEAGGGDGGEKGKARAGCLPLGLHKGAGKFFIRKAGPLDYTLVVIIVYVIDW